ncbi:hypothetical protein [Hyphomicrobium sp.]|uniref:hypothetical protein n=1 Tax=Hyphomicrobium sp. TaxID=82 RepID=UPI0025C4FD85|nr:hypothetical protein [Hyphomicrobium sp.]MCC7253437.1 hypothetical protein [Hyphomicrobium sp.]
MLKRVPVLAGASLVLSFANAAALEYCVTCEGPPAMYRCVIGGTEEGPGKDSSVSLYCISQMAAKGGHERCAVSRGAPFPCPGLTAVVEQPRELPTLAAPPSDTPAAPAAVETHEAKPAEPAPAPETQPARVPRTMEELAGDTVKSSQQGLKKAGEAIGGTAKKAGEQLGNAGSAIGTAASKTWTCITSLFSTCGGESETEGEAAPPAELETN